MIEESVQKKQKSVKPVYFPPDIIEEILSYILPRDYLTGAAWLNNDWRTVCFKLAKEEEEYIDKYITPEEMKSYTIFILKQPDLLKKCKSSCFYPHKLVVELAIEMNAYDLLRRYYTDENLVISLMHITQHKDRKQCTVFDNEFLKCLQDMPKGVGCFGNKWRNLSFKRLKNTLFFVLTKIDKMDDSWFDESVQNPIKSLCIVYLNKLKDVKTID
jgi:hypothetical protein